MADRATLDEMPRSNFVEIYVGCESGSNLVLKNMHKGEVFEQYLQFFKSVKGKRPCY
ncbi:MAG: hypothetical protein HXS46_10150 [Theionarchaea archaeon]|nr:hypothetical protein [Theionarchaea archaeon]